MAEPLRCVAPGNHHHRLGLQHRRRQVPGLRPRRPDPRRGPPADRPLDGGRRLRAEPDAAGRPGPGQHARMAGPAARAGPARRTGPRAASRPRTTPPAASTATASRCAGPSAGTTTPSPPTTPAAWNGSAARTACPRAHRRAVGRSATRSAISSRTRNTCRADDWQRTDRILPHGALAAGFLTGNFDVVSVSAAASTGIMDLRTNAVVPADARRPGRRRSIANWPGNSCRASSTRTSRSGPLSSSLALEAGDRRGAAAADLPDVGRSAGRAGRRRGGRCRPGGRRSSATRRWSTRRRPSCRPRAAWTPCG